MKYIVTYKVEIAYHIDGVTNADMAETFARERLLNGGMPDAVKEPEAILVEQEVEPC